MSPELKGLPRWPLLIFLLSGSVCLARALWVYPSLPDRMAIHFDLNGKINGWANKFTNLSLSIGLWLFITLLLGGIALLIRYKSKIETTNIPNRDFWLAPERREETLRILASLPLLTGAYIMGIIGYIMEFVYQANLTPAKAQAPSLAIGYSTVFLSGVLMAWTYWRFRLPKGMKKA